MKPFPRRFEPHVTRHALLRWLERVRGVDIDAVRREILAAGRGEWAAKGASSVTVPDHAVRLVIVDGRIVTVKPLGHDRPAEGPRLREEADDDLA